MTTPKVLTEADADLAGLPRPVSDGDLIGDRNIAAVIRQLVSERDALAGRVAELEAERDRSRQQFVDVSVAFMSFVPESEAAAKSFLQKLGDAHGYGWCQQALGEMWDIKHDCAPRGSMGVTVGKCNPPKLWTKRSQDAYRKGWNDHATLTPATNEAVGAIYERCAQIAFDADHMGSVNLKLLKNRIGNSIRAALSATTPESKP